MIHFFPFRLDPVNQSLSKCMPDGEIRTLAVGPRPFEMLQHLIYNHGRLVTHEELLGAVWPNQWVQPEVLKSHIKSIRSVLDDDAREPRYVETHRGRGYRFIAALDAPDSDAAPQGSSIRRPANLVGRESEFAQLREYFGQASSGTPQIVFVPGEIGSGKSALVDQFIDTLATSNAQTAIGHCLDGYADVEPYYPVLTLLTQLSRGEHAGAVRQELATLAPSWARHIPGLVANPHASHTGAAISARPVLREIQALLERLTLDCPIVLVLEDAHSADHSTIDWIAATASQAHRARHTRLMLIVTYRPEDACVADHPIGALHQDLAIRALCRDVPLNALKDDDVRTYLQMRAPNDPPEHLDRLARFIAERSGGNASFMVAMLNEVLQTRDDARPISVRRAPHDGEFPTHVPPLIARVIERRIARLGDLPQRVLEAASLTGDTFEAESAARAAGIAIETVEDVCEALCRQGCFIARVERSRSSDPCDVHAYQFRHVLYRQVCYERQSPIRRERMTQRIAQTADETVRPRVGLGETVAVTTSTHRLRPAASRSRA
ncbi:ATP-binding protein [Pararobbsia silviterrae]|nr:AAA family ATPase [Pararobbsia silviterrae]